MSRKDAWMPLYIGDYLADTMHLSTVEHGAYLLLLMNYWRTGPLPDDDKALCAIAKVSRREWDRDIGPTVRAFFTTADGVLTQGRMEREREAAGQISEKRRAAAMARHHPNGWQPPPDGHANAHPNADSNASPNGHASAVQVGRTSDANGLTRATRASASPSPSNQEPKQQQLSGSVGHARDPELPRRSRMPCANDPPPQWFVLADRLPDGSPKCEVDSRKPALGPRPIVAGYYLDGVAEECVIAMRASFDWRGDWHTLCGWLRDGREPHEHILPAIRRVMERRGADAEPIGRLAYFDQAVREQRRAAA